MNKQKSIFVILGLFAVFSVMVPSSALADVLPPKKQTDLNVSAKKVICKEGLVKVIKKSNGKPACVTPDTAEKFEKRGLVEPIDKKLLETIKNRSPVGSVKKISVTKVFGDSGRLNLSPTTIAYNVIFEVCSNNNAIRSPEVLLSSDSEVKRIKLSNKILANSCEISAGTIKTTNPDSITTTLINQGGITDRITSLENKIKELQEKLGGEKSNLATSARMSEKPTDYKQKVSDSTGKISELRKELNAAKEEYYRYLFSFYAKSAKISDYKRPLSFGGLPIEGVLINKLSVTEQVGVMETPPLYNVVFEACAGNNIVRAPQIEVSSDSGAVIVKLADKILPNSCQMGNGKIKASDTESVSVSLKTPAEASEKIASLEKMISDLQAIIAADKTELNNLVRLAPEKRPADFDQKVTELTANIADLRSQINDARTELYRILSQIYQ
ncbi:MAG TPA: hypothetical protein VFG25_03165 [Nitrosopumilaceae archaeon]|nr:hypothetical protein [Nitrosopumilaceae archaeon]